MSCKSPSTHLAATLTTLLLIACPASGRPAFFWNTTGGTFASVDYLDMEDADFDTGEGGIGGTRSLITAQYAFDHEAGWVAGVGHEYNALDIEEPGASPPQANGDLHTLHLASQWRTSLDAGELRLALAPAVSVSSNGLKNPDELGSDSLQLWGAALYSRPSGALTWVLGAAHDYRFGEGRYYPVAGIEWQNETWHLRAVYPDIQVTWTLAGRWLLTGEIAPDGNEWQAFDRDLEASDEFRREAWQAQLGLAYRFGNGIEIGCLAGMHWDQQWRYRRQDGSLARPDSDDSAYLGLRLGWHRP